ncbi:MAG: helix-turn-helix transcriptional regulator [Lachnospiraceae bacterium]|nr:helix-turn-helix transcriptional regulator [Lachnospiraceae bacterium]
MFINKSTNGTNNLCGKNVSYFRKRIHLSQRQLADKLQITGLDIDKNAIQRIEAGKRFVTDIELKKLSVALDVSIEELLEDDNMKIVKEN